MKNPFRSRNTPIVEEALSPYPPRSLGQTIGLSAVAVVGIGAAGFAALEYAHLDRTDPFEAYSATKDLKKEFPGAEEFKFSPLDEVSGTMSFRLPNGSHCVSIVREKMVGGVYTRKDGSQGAIIATDLITTTKPIAICEK